MRVLRPLPFAEGREPGIRALLKPLLAKLKARLPGSGTAEKTS
jgi:uncharacterized membrane protein YcjF (UPF0283 family)